MRIRDLFSEYHIYKLKTGLSLTLCYIDDPHSFLLRYKKTVFIEHLNY